MTQKGHTCKLKMLLQTKNSASKLNIVHAKKQLRSKLKIENISMQIKNEKSCARSMSDEDLVGAVRPGLTAVGPFMFHVCCCGATEGSEQQHNQDLKEIYKGRRILKYITFYHNALHLTTLFTTMHCI